MPDSGELALVVLLFLLCLAPLATDLAGMGRASPGVLGAAAGGALLTGRELASQLRTRARARRRRDVAPNSRP